MLGIEQFSSSHPSQSHIPLRSTIPLKTHQRTSSAFINAHPRPLSPSTATSIADGDFDLDIDAEISGLEDGQSPWHSVMGKESPESAQTQRRNPTLITLGLVIHSLADGLALGASLAAPALGSDEEHSLPGAIKDTPIVEGIPITKEMFSGLSLVVFAALALHKGTCTYWYHVPST